MPLECQSRSIAATSKFTISSFHSLRRDVYEKDVRLYWYEGGLKGKKLKPGLRICCQDTCMRISHIHACIYSYGCQEPKNTGTHISLLLDPIAPLFRKKERNTTREESSDAGSDADLHGDMEPGQFQFEPAALDQGLVWNPYGHMDLNTSYIFDVPSIAKP